MSALIFIIFFVGPYCTILQANGQVKLIFGEVTNYAYEVPSDMKGAVRFYPKSIPEDARYAHVFSTYCALYPSKETYFCSNCHHLVRVTFNGFIIDTFRVKQFGIYPEAVNSILVVTPQDPVAEVTEHYAVIRMSNSDCKIRQYVLDAYKDGYSTFRRSTTDCDDPKTKQYYWEPRLGMKVSDLLEHQGTVGGSSQGLEPKRLLSIPVGSRR